MLTDEQKIIIMQALQAYKKSVIRRAENYPAQSTIYNHHIELSKQIHEIEVIL